MKISDWAYFAGLFDGEGSVTITITTRKSDTQSCKAGQVQSNESLRISNNNPVPLLELEEKFGGRVRSHSADRPDSWVWICQGHASVKFAKKILPYVRVKKGQLEIYIAFMALKRRKALGRTKLTDDELAVRRSLKEELDRVRVEEGGKGGFRLISGEPL